jgi:hypothetical protein
VMNRRDGSLLLDTGGCYDSPNHVGEPAGKVVAVRGIPLEALPDRPVVAHFVR